MSKQKKQEENKTTEEPTQSNQAAKETEHNQKQTEVNETCSETQEKCECDSKTNNLSVENLELKNTLQRLQAEFENYRKRCDKNNTEFIKMANEGLITDILPVLDNFELALKSAKEKDDFYKGMELIYSQVFDILESNGAKLIPCQGKFNPYFQEALLTEESDKEPNTILEELQKGYLLNDKVIRHAKVKIAKKKNN